jgi:hypothetical protein
MEVSDMATELVPDITITIKPLALSDGSLAHHVFAHQNSAALQFFAINQRSSDDFFIDLAQLIDRHTLTTTNIPVSA